MIGGMFGIAYDYNVLEATTDQVQEISNCAIAGTACSVCEPYKKRLIDAVYHINHLYEYYAQYEVVSTPQTTAGGTTHCTHCGANSSNPYICEYCGSQLSEAPASSGKIQVSAASEIPNPIMEAQDIIWERYDVLLKQFSATSLVKNSKVKGSLIGDLVSSIFSSEAAEDEETSALGAKMSEDEIKEAAGLYGVSVGDYLTGLDNGKYLTLKGKKEADTQKASGTSTYTPDTMGMAGMAAVGMFASSMFSNSSRKRPQTVPQKPSQPVYREAPQSAQTNRTPSREPEHRPSQTRDIPQRPTQSTTSSASRHDFPERPASSGRPTQTSSTSRRPAESERVTPQKSRSDGPSKERHPENRRRN